MEQYENKTRTFALTALFAAIIFLLAFTPIGYLNLGIIKATIIHVPVIIGSILLGPKIGALLGFFFGFTSLINNTVSPSLLSFAFSPLIPVPGIGRGSMLALAVCFIPRILVGIFPYYADKLVAIMIGNKQKSGYISNFTAGIVGSMTNTLLVMHLIYFIFQDAYATARDVGPEVIYGMILSVIFMHGIPEAITAGVFSSAVCRALRIRSKDGGEPSQKPSP